MISFRDGEEKFISQKRRRDMRRERKTQCVETEIRRKEKVP